MQVRPVILYRDTCGKCRLLSRLAVAASLGRLSRLPLSSPRAAAILHSVPAARGKLVLLDGDSLVTGWRVIPAALWRIQRRVVRHA
jgi:hypothetical protein